MVDKWLIINADDFGIHHDVNIGIIQAHTFGLVQSTSLMVNTPATKQGTEILKDHPLLEVGLHLNISTQKAISPPNQIPDLANDQGIFLFNGSDIAGSFHWIRKAIDETPGFLQQIEIEFNNQVELFMRLMGEPAHINIHHYLSYAHPKLFELYVKLADQGGYPCRGLCYPVLDTMQIPSSIIKRMKHVLDEHAIPYPSYSISNLFSKNVRIPNDIYQIEIVTLLKRLYFDLGITSVELVTHPSLISPFILNHDHFARARILETHLTTSESFQSQIIALGYKVGKYSAL